MLDDTSRLTELLLRWQELRACGRTVSVEELCADAPELAPLLRQQIAKLLEVESFLDMSTTSQGDHPTPERAATEDFSALLAPPEGAGELGRLGGYRVLKLLGAGGMGVVFQAEDPHLRRSVALKILKPSLAVNEDARRRFLREAQAMAALEHDHVVAVYQVGEDRGIPFVAMPLLKGETLEARLRREGRLPVAEVLHVGREIAEGLSAAHARGLIHRDIKPANVWLETLTGGRRPPGFSYRVKILDFGLARPVSPGTHLTTSGAFLGTPSYAAPEQAEGQPLDERCDLFSLGCVLYHCGTGVVPFPGESIMAILRSLALDEPKSPGVVNPEIPPPLSALILGLLAKDRGGRPSSAHAVADALAEIQEEYVALPADPSGSAGEERQAAKREQPRRRRALGLAAALGIVVVLAGVLIRIPTSRGTLVIESEDDGIEVVVKQNGAVIHDRTAKREIELKVGNYEIELAEGKDGLRLSTKTFTITRDGKETVRVTLEKPEVGVKPPEKNLPPIVPNVLGRLDPARIPVAERFPWQPKELVAVIGEHRGRHWGTVTSISSSADGKVLATAAEEDGVRVWNAPSMKEIGRISSRVAGRHALAVAPDGKSVALGLMKGPVELWDVTGAEPKRKWASPGTSERYHLLFAPDGKTLYRAASGEVAVWDVTGDGPKERAALTEIGKVRWVNLALSPNGRWLAAGTTAHQVHLWDLSGERPRHVVKLLEEGRKEIEVTVAFWNDSSKLIAASGAEERPGQDWVWDLADAGPKERPPFQSGYSLAMKVIAAGGKKAFDFEYAGDVWDINLLQPPSKKGPITQMPGRWGQYTSHTGGGDGRIELHRGSPWCYVPATEQVYSTGGADEIRLWDLWTGEAVLNPKWLSPGLSNANLSPDGRWLFAAARGGEDRLWNLDGTVPTPIPLPVQATGDPGSMVFAPNGKTALWRDRAGKAHLLDLSGVVPEVQRSLGSVNVEGTVFSPDGTRLASVGREGIQYWDLTQPGRPAVSLRHPRQPSSPEMRLCFSGDGKRLAALQECPSSKEEQLEDSIAQWDLSGAEPKLLCAVALGGGHVVDLVSAPEGGLACVSHGALGVKAGEEAADKVEECRLIDISESGELGKQRVLFRVSWHRWSGSGTFGGPRWGRFSFPAENGNAEQHPLAFSAGGRTVVATFSSGRVVVFDTVRHEVRLDEKLPGAIRKAVLTADGRGLLLENANFTVYVLRLPASGTVALRPLDPEWVRQLRTQKPDKQVETVTGELLQRNPWFDGKVAAGYEGDAVVSLRFITDDVSDLTLLQALPSLKRLSLRGSAFGKGRLTDLTPLRGLKLQALDLRGNVVPDLTPLRDVPLETLLYDFQGKDDRAAARAIPTLRSINGKDAEDFWKEDGGK